MPESSQTPRQNYESPPANQLPTTHPTDMDKQYYSIACEAGNDLLLAIIESDKTSCTDAEAIYPECRKFRTDHPYTTVKTTVIPFGTGDEADRKAAIELISKKKYLGRLVEPFVTRDGRELDTLERCGNKIFLCENKGRNRTVRELKTLPLVMLESILFTDEFPEEARGYKPKAKSIDTGTNPSIPQNTIQQ